MGIKLAAVNPIDKIQLNAKSEKPEVTRPGPSGNEQVGLKGEKRYESRRAS